MFNFNSSFLNCRCDEGNAQVRLMEKFSDQLAKNALALNKLLEKRLRGKLSFLTFRIFLFLSTPAL